MVGGNENGVRFGHSKRAALGYLNGKLFSRADNICVVAVGEHILFVLRIQ